jgi:hypothetical protein
VRFITGGRSVMAHILSPWSKDLFHRAIVQSGAITDLRNLIPSHPPEYYARQVCPFIWGNDMKTVRREDIEPNKGVFLFSSQ